MYLPRTIEKTVSRVSRQFKVLLLTGMRQVGKTTLLTRLGAANRASVTLDDLNDRELAKNDPALFFQTYAPPLLLDEVQYAPEVFSQIKLLADRSDTRGDFWLTGSQQFLLMKNVTETLAGRVAILELHGLSIYEREGRGLLQQPYLPAPKPASALPRKSLPETFATIWKGSLPEVAENDSSFRDNFYSSYVKTYIERDVRQLTHVGDELSFHNFLRVIAARTAQELNLSDIATAVGVSVNTAKAWLSVLRTSGIVHLLQPYFGNFTKRLVKRPKIYFFDTGLCAYLTSWPTPETLASGAMSGAIFETFVVSEILKSHRHNGLDTPLYFYRDNNKVEIDLLIESAGKLHPVEIRKSATPGKGMVASFSVIDDLDKPRGHGALVCLIDKPTPLATDITAHSIWDI
ncbi:MAG: ATP-binding protein [Opitutaceae bacterium]|jgi:predicted AAA+ superfamily ATPase|nr:ATP-binding protein [Opitutaceae bacterium]